MIYFYWLLCVFKLFVVVKDSFCFLCLLIKKKNNYERFWIVCVSCIEFFYGKKYVCGIFWFSGIFIFFWIVVCR